MKIHADLNAIIIITIVTGCNGPCQAKIKNCKRNLTHGLSNKSNCIIIAFINAINVINNVLVINIHPLVDAYKVNVVVGMPGTTGLFGTARPNTSTHYDDLMMLPRGG